MKKALYSIIFILGIIVGIQVGASFQSSSYFASLFGKRISSTGGVIAFNVSVGILFGFIFIIFIPLFAKALKRIYVNFSGKINNTTFTELAIILLAFILALIVSALLCIPFNNMGLPVWLETIIMIAIYVICIYLFITIALYKAPEAERMIKKFNPFNSLETDGFRSKNVSKKKSFIGVAKILDTSAIIDGRILDILKTGFVDGPIVVPEFVIHELQIVADSSDSIKRARGRRGLDILNQIKTELPIEVIVLDRDYPELKEVDTKLLKLAIDIDAKIVTTDYNLNKIAIFQGVDILNTNELSNAVKTVVIPGEELYVKVIKEGKENSQGIAYMEDGTMIVVEEGRSKIGQEINTVVTSVLQTSAGRMIFVKPV